jgi:4-hydroxyphenylacetate 3-monooxygenase
MNVNVACMAATSDYCAQNRPEFKQNIINYYEFIREQDLVLTHTLVNLQRNRAPVGTPVEDRTDVALSVVRETDKGIVVRGPRVLATLGPLADEIAVYPARSHRLPGTALDRYAFAFAIPCGTPGLRFLCRESYDLGRSSFDHPLGSRFEEMDAIVFFDDVLVPWERVFLLGDVELVNDTGVATGSHIHTAHQGAAKNIAKSELVLGVALLMAETLGSTQVPHVQERLAELMVHTEVMKASLRAAEADAQLDRWGVMCPAGLPLEVIRTLFMNVYPRMVEILQLMGSSSFMIIPSEKDFDSAMKPEIEQYLATDTASARERVKLFRLAWDIACSAFGGRQVLYERFFAGDPLNRAQFLYSIYPKDSVMERVREFLGHDHEA